MKIIKSQKERSRHSNVYKYVFNKMDYKDITNIVHSFWDVVELFLVQFFMIYDYHICFNATSLSNHLLTNHIDECMTFLGDIKACEKTDIFEKSTLIVGYVELLHMPVCKKVSLQH